MKYLPVSMMAATPLAGVAGRKEAIQPLAEAARPEVTTYVADDNPDPAVQKVARESWQTFGLSNLDSACGAHALGRNPFTTRPSGGGGKRIWSGCVRVQIVINAANATAWPKILR